MTVPCPECGSHLTRIYDNEALCDIEGAENHDNEIYAFVACDQPKCGNKFRMVGEIVNWRVLGKSNQKVFGSLNN